MGNRYREVNSRVLRNSVVAFVMILLALCSAACTTVGALTPAEAVRQNLARLSPERAVTLQVLGTRQWERGVVVLYTYVIPAEDRMPALPNFGYSLVAPNNWGTWYITDGAGGGSTEPPPVEDLISYGFGSGSNRVRGDFSIVYGRTLVPQVASMQAAFDNGQVLQDGTGDGVFALILPLRAAVCELRVLDAQGEVLRRVEPGANTAPEKLVIGPTTGCPPSGLFDRYFKIVVGA